MKGAEIYDILRFVIMLVVAIVFIIAVYMYLVRGDTSPLSNINNQVKTSSVCGSDAECKEGVCVGGGCVCFIDQQCRISKKCDMGTGVCGK